MRVVVTFVFLFNIAFGYSQKPSTDVQVEYELFLNTDIPIKLFATLCISGNTSIYQEKFSTTKRWEERSTTAEGVDMTPSKDVFEPYLKIDRNKKEILFYDVNMKNFFLVKDNYKEFTWEITQDTKTIAGLSCIKATTSFRGRDWVAWFAPEVPLPFGPWKLHGLPGLILEAHDATNKYTMKAVKIENKKAGVFDKDFNKLIKTTNSKPISYKELLEDREEAQNNFIRESNIKMAGKGSVTINPAPRSGEELYFEWEQ